MSTLALAAKLEEPPKRRFGCFKVMRRLAVWMLLLLLMGCGLVALFISNLPARPIFPVFFLLVSLELLLQVRPRRFRCGAWLVVGRGAFE